MNNLSPVTSSLPACFYPTNHGSPRAKQLPDALLPILQNLCAVTPALSGRKLDLTRKAWFRERPKLWTVRALMRIKKRLKDAGKEDEYNWVAKAVEKSLRRSLLWRHSVRHGSLRPQHPSWRGRLQERWQL